MRTKKVKRLLLMLCCVLCVVTSLSMFACAKKNNASFTGFLKGCLTKATLGSELLVEEFIDKTDVDDYKVTVSLGDFSEQVRYAWVPDSPGEWVMTYEVLSGKNKGAYKHKVQVVVQSISYQYTLSADATTYELGDEMDFDKFFDSLHFYYNSYYDCTPIMQSVFVDGERIDLTEQASFKFEIFAPHYFRFIIRSEDGQERLIIVEITVRNTSAEAKTFMENNDVEAYGYSSFDNDLNVALNAGWTRSSNTLSDLPYVAWHGQYGVGTYAKFDFTGNNMPKVAFFTDAIKNTLVDGSQGLYIGNGTLFTSGNYMQLAEFSQLTIYGPNKISNRSWTSTDQKFVRDGTPSNPSPASRAALEDGVHYRYILGFEDAQDTTQVTQTGDSINDAGNATFHCLLVNLDVGEIIYDFKTTFGFNEAQISKGQLFKKGYFNGNIIAYGNFGVTTTFKVYPLEEDVDDIYTLYDCVQFKESKQGARRFVASGEEMNVSDYIDTGSLYTFGYIKEDAVYASDYATKIPQKAGFVKIDGNTFSIHTEGVYRLYYDDGSHIPASIRLTVTDSMYTVGFENKQNFELIKLYGTGHVRYAKSLATGVSSQGARSLSINMPKQSVTLRFRFDSSYFDAIFADPEVTHFKFDVKLSHDHKIVLRRSLISNVETAVGTTWQTVTVSKEQYEIYKDEKFDAYENAFEILVNATALPADDVTLYLDNLAAVKSKTVYASQESSKELEIEIGENVTAVKIGENSIDYTQDNGKIKIAYSALYEYSGHNALSIFAGEKELSYNLEVITDTIDFEDGYESSAITVGLTDAYGTQYKLLLSIAAGEGNGGYALKGVTESATVYFDLRPQYLDFGFDELGADYLEFSLYTDKYIRAANLRTIAYKNDGSGDIQPATTSDEAYIGSELIEDGHYVIRISRAAYAWWKNLRISDDIPLLLQLQAQDEEQTWVQFGTLYLDDFTFGHLPPVIRDTLYIGENDEDAYQIDVEGVVSATLNGQNFTQYSSTATGIEIDKSVLYNYINVNGGLITLVLTTENGSVTYELTIEDKIIDFENGRLHSAITKGLTGSGYALSTLEIDGESNGNGTYSLKGVGDSRTIYIDILGGYLEAVFEDASVDGLEFKLYTSITLSAVNLRAYKNGAAQTTSNQATVYTEYRYVSDGGYYLIYVLRSGYDWWKRTITVDGDPLLIQIQRDEGLVGTFYLDDFTAYTSVELPTQELDTLVYVGAEDDDNLTLDIAGALSMTVNGQEFTHFTANDTNVAIDKSELYKLMTDRIGLLTITTDEVIYTLTVEDKEIDFENGRLHSAITTGLINRATSNTEIIYRLTLSLDDSNSGNGKYSLKGTTEGSTFSFDIRGQYLASVFADTSVDHIEYKFYVDQSIADKVVYFHQNIYTIASDKTRMALYGAITNASCRTYSELKNDGEKCYYVMYVTKAMYEWWKENGTDDSPLTISLQTRDASAQFDPKTFYLDDFRFSNHKIIDFEDGKWDSNSSAITTGLTGASYVKSLTLDSGNNGNGKYSLKALSTSKTTYFDIRKEYLAEAFSDPKIAYIEFKLFYTDNDINTLKLFIKYDSGSPNTNNENYVRKELVDGHYVIKITRDGYEEWWDTNKLTEDDPLMIQIAFKDTVASGGTAFYLDDLKACEE